MKTKDWGLSSPIPEKPSEIKRILTIVLFILVIVSSGCFTGFSIESLIKNSGEAKDIIGKMFFPPDFSYAKRLMDPMIETVQISLVGTILGAIFLVISPARGVDWPPLSKHVGACRGPVACSPEITTGVNSTSR